ncbi:MAG: flagellar biosynthesis protein FlhA [Marinicaulis sp.]|nr:flagellar biosynthesis protein FlhA [Marinicaulis sp.]NNE41858.1 flagellar biosynthesis protein FlhA [Marinicaulis sp.]NNL90288.1 flagellar biosynthesis protein FlhA [Marinicaulis sp.]
MRYMDLNKSNLYQPTVLLAVALMAVIVMMVLPAPAWVVDVGLTASFALAILIFTITLFIERPLDFSSFPTILLASLLLRLSLNVSSTKLIIGQGHTGPDAAGGIIQGFAMFIMGGNVFLGLVVFIVLLIVNFMVITKGAGRMAEVGARFALDGMPGKQLAIDSDIAAGAIDHEEAKNRRKTEQEETTFFGSLDGASKFVKGDAIAGLLITVLNLIVGLAIGLGVHKLSFGQALETYSILTVGDGLVSQIPAVIISIAAALLLSKGGVLGSADKALFNQLGEYPAAIATVAVMMFVFALFPGMPFIPFVSGALLLSAGAYYALRQEKSKNDAAAKDDLAPELPTKESLGDILDLDEIHVEFAPNIVPICIDADTGLDDRIVKIRNYIAGEYGFIVPAIRLTDNTALKDNEYVIRIHGVEVARSILEPNSVLVLKRDDIELDIPGTDVSEPVFRAPARWIPSERQEDASIMGLPVIEPVEVAATHLLEVIKDNFGRLMTRRALQRILDEFVSTSDAAKSEANRKILDDFITDEVPHDLIQAVLRLLLDEKISIRNLPVILEAIAEGRSALSSPEQIAEYVRQRIGFQFVSKLRTQDGGLPLIQLSPDWEQLFSDHEIETPTGQKDIALPPMEFNRLAAAIREKVGAAVANGTFPAVVSSAKRRRFLNTVLAAKGIRNPVIAYEEIDPSERPSIVGVA